MWEMKTRYFISDLYYVEAVWKSIGKASPFSTAGQKKIPSSEIMGKLCFLKLATTE